MNGILGLGHDRIAVDKLSTCTESFSLSAKSFSFHMKNHPEESYLAIPGIDEERGLREMASLDVIERTCGSLNFTKTTGPQRRRGCLRLRGCHRLRHLPRRGT